MLSSSALDFEAGEQFVDFGFDGTQSNHGIEVIERDGGHERHERFRVRKIYPEADSTAEGVYPWEESLRLMVPPKGTLLFEIQSTSEPIRRTLPRVSPTVPVERAFLRLADLRNVIGVTDLWRALTLPGSGKMPGF